MKFVRAAVILTTVAVVGACVEPQAPPPPPPPPRPAPVAPRPAPPPPPADWRDLPLTAGDWSYRNLGGNSRAEFAPPSSQPVLIISCDRAARQVTLSRLGTTSGNTMTVRTSFGARNLPLSVQTDPVPYVYSGLRAADNFLDQIAFSRGRITVEVPGTPMLVIPAWAEPARVIEDCRI